MRISVLPALLLAGLSAFVSPMAKAGVGCPWCDVAFTECVRGAGTEAQKTACYDTLSDCREIHCGGPGNTAKVIDKPKLKMSPADLPGDSILDSFHGRAAPK